MEECVDFYFNGQHGTASVDGAIQASCPRANNSISIVDISSDTPQQRPNSRPCSHRLCRSSW